MRGDSKKPMDAFLVLARASFGDRRRRSPIRIVVTGSVLVLVLVALPICLLWPEPEEPQLILAASDGVTLPGVETPVCARVEPVSEARAHAALSDRNVYFHDLQANWEEQVTTDRAGVAILRRSFSPLTERVEIIVRYPGDGERRRGTQAKARVFVWPPETPLLLVDIDQTLPDGNGLALWDADNQEIRPRPGMVAALQAARAKLRIVYLSTAADRPSRHNTLRAWLERGWAPEPEQFPDGPVLTRAWQRPPIERAKFLEASVQALKRHFRGTLVAITGDHANARLFHEGGWPTYLLAEAGSLPEGVTAIRSWSELTPLLP
jgi:hypothetical protein